MNKNNNFPQQPHPDGKAKRRSGPRSRSSPYKGVTQYKRTGKWEAHIWIPGNARGKGHQRHLGSYNTAVDAARCFDRATIHVRGTQEELNFPLSDYAEDEFMLQHARTDNFKFLDLMRAQFAITTEAPQLPRRTFQPPNRTGGKAKSNTTSSDDGNNDGPDFFLVAKRGVKRSSPVSMTASPPLAHPTSRAHLSPRTTLTSRMLFKQQEQSPETPQTAEQVYQAMSSVPMSSVPAVGGIGVGSGTSTGLRGRTGPRTGTFTSPLQGGPTAVGSVPGGRLVGMLSDEARLSMRRLSNYTHQRVQQHHHRDRRIGFEEEEEEEEQDNGDVYDYTAFLQQHQQPMAPLFSAAETAWINAATTQTTGAFNPNAAALSFANTIAGLSMAPPSVSPAAAAVAAATQPTVTTAAVLPSRFIGTCGPILPPSPSTYPTMYNAMQFPTGAAAAYALQESFLLPTLIQPGGHAANGNGWHGAVHQHGDSGASSGSGQDDMDPATVDLLAGIQMISGQEASPKEYKDWLCNSPQELEAPSPRK